MATASTQWPFIDLPNNLAPFVDRFFDLLDHNTDDAGEKLADEIFAPDGSFGTSGGTYKGAKAISESRGPAWSVVESRTHKIKKVYTFDKEGSDLLMIGFAVMKLKNGADLEGDLVARMLLDKIGTEDMRIKEFQVWGDSGPMIKALQQGKKE